MDKTITGHTGLTALLGSPVAHSISPMMHNESFQLLNLDYVYLCFDIKEEQLETAVNGLKTMGIRGFNLTMPNKNKIVEMLDELSPAAKMIGAVNTVLHENGRLIGYNTDGIGFTRSVADAGHTIAGQTLTLMGAGGAATAIAAQTALDGAAVLNIFARPTSRFWERTCRLVRNINETTSCKAYLYDNADDTQLHTSLENSHMLINATSVGMAPNTDASIIPDASYFHPNLVVADVIYNPQETKLLKMAREAGCATFNGMYMLLYQGAEAFKIWTGKEMPVETIKEKYFRTV
ncbi:MAG: shikimate dehydrogenase [Lachnospiraceae bacterium]|jgi:shikimate dehydrogenase